MDTHVYGWWRTDRARLTTSALAAIEDEEDVAVSAVSAIEIATKQAAAKLADEPGFLDDRPAHDLVPLSLTWAHASEVRLLPLLPRDPFDRLLIAQARGERRTLVTAAPQVRAYDVASMPA